MLTVKRWRAFWWKYFLGLVVTFAPMIILSLVFSSGFVYMGQDTSSIFSIIIKTQPGLVLQAFLRVLGISLILCIGLQVITSSFKIKYKIIFSTIFFLAGLLRVSTIYPGISENWVLIRSFHFMRYFVQILSTLSVDSFLRILIQWLPFILILFASIKNFINHVSIMNIQSKILKKSENSIHIDNIDNASRIFSIQGVSLLIFIVFGTIFLFHLTSSFKINVAKNNTKQSRPNVFIFASDSMRYDRLADEKYSNVMPFLRSQLKYATLFKPMLVGIPRTFPSWVEIATGNYAIDTGIRTMFPARAYRMGAKESIFAAAQDSGYSTVFVSDFAGDIFPRYPFEASIINAPTSNLNSLIENGIISAFSPIQSILTLPNLQRVLPSMLESAEIADSRLVGHAVADSLSEVSKISKPVFMTVFFSSAHFPYASPGPWYSKFQQKDAQGNFMFRKIPDQDISDASKISLNISPEIKKQTIALYNGGLNSIDDTLKQLFTQLKDKGWLNNAIILVYGDHGENLYDGNMGMGHGDGVEGEYSNLTPLLVFTYGGAQPNPENITNRTFVRTIDLAPTIARRINVNFPKNIIDGVPLLDIQEKPSNFSLDASYQETGIWFIKDKLTPERQARIIYPGVASLLDIDQAMNDEFYVRNIYSQIIASVKERAWITDRYRLVMRSTIKGVIPSLYLRSDTTASHDLLIDINTRSQYEAIVNTLINNLNQFLITRGVEVIKNSKNTFYYVENQTP